MPRPRAGREPTPAALKRPERRPQEPRRDGRFDLSAWVFGMVERPEETPAEPFRQGLVRREPAGEPPRGVRRQDPDSGAHRRPARAPAADAAAVQPRPAAAPVAPEPPAQRGGGFDLAAWVFGLVPRTEDDVLVRPPSRPRAPRPQPPARKPLTMPDLFEGAPVPPCLDDD